jgi:hypothetical protein
VKPVEILQFRKEDLSFVPQSLEKVTNITSRKNTGFLVQALYKARVRRMYVTALNYRLLVGNVYFSHACALHFASRCKDKEQGREFLEAKKRDCLTT